MSMERTTDWGKGRGCDHVLLASAGSAANFALGTEGLPMCHRDQSGIPRAVNPFTFFLKAPPPPYDGSAREAIQLLGWHDIVHATGPASFEYC